MPLSCIGCRRGTTCLGSTISVTSLYNNVSKQCYGLAVKTVDSANMGRPRHYAQALRRRLIDECSHVISARSTAGVSLRDLAARAHTTTAAVYTWFGSRGDLLQAVTDEAFTRIPRYLDQLRPGADPRQYLLDLALAYRRSAMADPHFYRVMFSSPGSSSEHSDSLTEPTFDTLRRAVARVLPAADAERTELEALRLWAMVHGLVSLELSGLLPGTEQERQDRYRRVLHLHPLLE